MGLRAVLKITSANGQKINMYRILNEDTGEIRDISVENIIDMLRQGISIYPLGLRNNKIYQIENIISTPALRRNVQSFYDWCLENGERGQRVLTEFNTGGNFPIFAKDISAHGNGIYNFRCTRCNMVSKQGVNWKTREKDCKCKYCRGLARETSLKKWCLEHGEYGETLLQEYINGNNEITADKVLFSSNKYANFKCNKCGKINKQIISNKTCKNPRKCKYCDTTRTSFGEQLIFLWLQSQGLECYNRYVLTTDLGVKEVDIIIPSIKLVIEHQSALHGQYNRIINDIETKKILDYVGLDLLEVCRNDSNYMRDSDDWCITYNKDNVGQAIKELSNLLNERYNLITKPAYDRALEDQAYVNSCKVKKENSLLEKNKELIKEWYQPANGLITPDMVAMGSDRKYYWKCPICGHVYLASPSHRNAGTGCPNWQNHK